MCLPSISDELRGDRVRLRRAVEADVEPLAAILNEPAVARWWGRNDADDVRRDLIEAPCTLVIELAGAVVGVLMVDEERDDEYEMVGLDITLSTPHHGRGLGREALALVIDHLIDAHGHHRFTIDPAADNEIAIRCYAGVGFRTVGIMRQYERAPDGGWRDGLLMELLADDRRS